VAPWYLVIAGNIVAAFVSYRIVERPDMAMGRALLVKSAVPAPADFGRAPELLEKCFEFVGTSVRIVTAEAEG
jgi:hypothetical protein